MTRCRTRNTYWSELDVVDCFLLNCFYEGGVAGIVHGSPTANDGDYIKTSPIDSGKCEQGSVVTTQSGSHYFLGSTEAEGATEPPEELEGLTDVRPRATITLPKLRKKKEPTHLQQGTESPPAQKPRPTFSLFDVFGMVSRRRRNKHVHPNAVPTLTRWSTNSDGTITGIVSGSSQMKDGDIVTTSVIVSGDAKQNEKVTTVTGSTYYLE